ncbi:MAG: hypothetical protein PHY56_07860 [Candidatus Omnitrophica bacterium]|nr:hypothetical protein [Candidatus Omnitrophota bacterium]
MNPLLIAGAISKGKSIVWGILKWLAILGFIGICLWGLYAGLIRPTTKPNPSTTQRAENMTNNTHNYKGPTLGCMSVRVMASEAK